MQINYLAWICQAGDYLRCVSHGRYRLGVKSLRCGSNISEEPLVRFQLPTLLEVDQRFFFFLPNTQLIVRFCNETSKTNMRVEMT